MDKKGKSAIIFGLVAVLALIAFLAVVIAHINPQGEQTHSVGLETESCQDALTGAEEQLADRGSINSLLLDNIEDKCGVECSIEFDAAHEPVLVCGETCEPVPEVDGCLNIAMETYEFCLNAGGEPEQCRQRMKEVLSTCESGGACIGLSSIEELGLPLCCTEVKPNDLICGVDAEWVVGITAVPTCYIQGS